jgi:hypothetical protein
MAPSQSLRRIRACIRATSSDTWNGLATYVRTDAEKAVEFEFYAGIDGDGVVSKTKIGSPALTFGQHRNARTLKVKCEN